MSFFLPPRVINLWKIKLSMADRPITRRLKIYINGEEIDATISNISKNLAKFRSLANRAVEGTPEWKKYNTEVAKLEVELKKARDAQKDFRDETKLSTSGIKEGEKAIGKFTSSFNDLIQGYKRGDLLQIKEGWTGVRSSIKGATKAALSFIATPMGAAIAILVGVGAAAKEWFNYNQQVVEALRLTTQLTGLTDKAADAARIRGEVISETFGVDFKETMLTANSLVQQFKISFDEAFDLIEGQLIRGQKHNDEFFQSLNEYPVFFKRAQFSAEEFARVIATGYDLGIYTDKLPDAIKEATLSLEEQTKTSRDALENAFGKKFTEELFLNLRKGSITVKDALKLISEEAEKVGLNSQQSQQLTADLFRGAGEDAGGALKVFEAINIALNEQQRELTESERILQDQVQATKELKQVSSALFATGDEGFGLIIDKAKLLGTKILIDILKAGVDLTNWFIDLNNRSTTFSGILTFIGEIGTAQLKVLVTGFQNLGGVVRGVGDVIEGIFTGDVSKVQDGLARQLAAGKKFFDELKNKGVESANRIKEAFNGNNKLERISIGDFVAGGGGNDEGPNKPTDPNGKGGDKGGLTAEDKRILESRKKLREFLKQIEEEEEIQKELKKFDEDQRAEEEDILRLEKKFQKMREEAGLTNELNEELSEEEKSLLAQLEEAKEFELQQVRDKHAKIRQKKDEEDKKKALEREKRLKAEQIKAERELQEAKRELLDVGIEALKGFFDESSSIYKALFLAQKAVAAAQVVVDGIAERAKISAVWGWNPAIAGPLLAASKIRTATSLIGIAGTAIQGLEDGGETFSGPSSGGVDGRGGRLAILHPDEYVVPKVVRQDPSVPAIIDYLESKRKQKLGSFENGGNVGPSYPDRDQSSALNAKLLDAVEMLILKLDEPLTLEYTLNSERERRELAEKLDSTINEAKGL